MKDLYNKLRNELENNLAFLDDKPEETIDSTLQALWHKAAGRSVSAKMASKFNLPSLSENQAIALQHSVKQRLGGKPLTHITERQNFMGIEFISDRRALIPRAETEILTNAALQICIEILRTQKMARIFDVCCGSGNVGLSLAKLLDNVFVYSSDLSEEAVDLTQENVKFLNLHDKVKALPSDLFASFELPEFYNKVDVITCNPPYISTAKVSKMNTEISENEPLLAFDGGMMGIKIIQKLIADSPRFLSPNGWLLFELGLGQGPFLLKLLESNEAYGKIETFNDNTGNIRAIAAKKKSKKI
jgi:release factor glutamine methyltransferase